MATFLLVLSAAATASAEWKEKAWQCETAMTRIRVIEAENNSRAIFTEPEIRIHTHSNTYFTSVAAAVRASFHQLSNKTDLPSVCRYSDFMREHHDNLSTTYGYSFEEQEEKTHDFLMPLDWKPYRNRIRKIQEDSKYPVGNYQVCNYVCKSKRVDPDDKSISLR